MPPPFRSFSYFFRRMQLNESKFSSTTHPHASQTVIFLTKMAEKRFSASPHLCMLLELVLPLSVAAFGRWRNSKRESSKLNRKKHRDKPGK